MYMAAHPDDENTSLISYLANGEQLKTTYLSLTRGDGGQNLIGTEKGDLLGLVRANELDQARAKDGGEQYFTRAVDFGYSKNEKEAFAIWNKTEVLKDVVWNIRRIRPDIIITRFPPDYRAGHGHHTASAILAMDAYTKAADKNFKFNDARDGKLEPWQVKRVVWNTSWWAYRRSGKEFPPKGVLSMEVGHFNPNMGVSYNSIASKSRSTHRSQGFGTIVDRGSDREYFEHLKGDSAEKHIFDDLDFSWTRFGDYKLAKKIDSQVDKILSRFDQSTPSESVDALLDLRNLIKGVDDQGWKDYKVKQIDAIIAASMGLWLECLSDHYYASHGDSMVFKLTGLNRSKLPVVAKSMSFIDETRTLDDTVLYYNKVTELALIRKYINPNLKPTQPYWLQKERKGALFAFEDPTSIGWVDQQPFSKADVWLEVNNEIIKIEVPIQYKWRDGSKGELRRPFEIRSRVSLNFQHPFYLFTGSESREVELTITGNKEDTEGNVWLELPKGWKSNPKELPFKTDFRGQAQIIRFTVTPEKGAENGLISAKAVEAGYEHKRSLIEIDYEHIPAQVHQPIAQSRVAFEDIRKTVGKKIAYLPGAGDNVPEALRSIGYEVEMLDPENIQKETFQNHKVVIVGIRAYNTLSDIPNIHTHLMKFVENGGKVIVQYNTSYSLKNKEIGPYGLQPSRKRITDETAEMTLLQPQHPVFNKPNKIGAKDFEGWVQERGLYFADEFSDKYTPLLSGADPDEEPLNGSLLVTQYGKGQFVYTGLSFFRELPAGVTGAYKLMVNLIEF